jgi:GT2 family glycosyltransferase
MSGASAYRRVILNKIKWDTALKKYSWNDDIDISYRVFREYPGTLYMNPRAKYFHEGSRSGRNSPIEVIYASEVYDFYLFFKNIDSSPENFYIFLKSRVGRLVLNIFFDVVHLSKKGMIKSYHRINAFMFALKHIKELRRGDLIFFNSTLKY